MTRRERLEKRAEKRRDWAGSAAAKADAAHERVHQIADGIPFGQPILVGHHSEGRARRDQARMESGMRTSVDESRKATRHEEVADNIDRHLRESVFSDDEDAVERLTEIVADLEAKRGEMKRKNADYRREHRAELAAMTPYERSQAIPYPSYSLTNLGATIRQKTKRIEQLKRERAVVAAGGRGAGRHMESRYQSVCADCGGTIERGSRIVWYRLTREAVHADYVDGILSASCPGPEAGS